MASTLAKIRKERLEKIEKMRAKGINPFPARSKRTHKNEILVKRFNKYEGESVTVVGRIMAWREHGALKFADLQDASGKIQLIIHEEKLHEFDKEKQLLGWEELKFLDIGDHIQVSGKIKKSKRGEESVEVTELKILAKAIRPLPEKWSGIKDKEIRYRRRYLDLTIDPEKKELFRRKAKFWEANRTFMKKQGFMEVETPIMEHVPGGADANPFITHHNALNEDFYLRISPELYLKRLIGGGYEKVFTIGPNFRNEGIDDEHLQEFYNIEWYWAYADYRDNMNMIKKMFRYLAKEVYGTTKFKNGKHEFDLADEWEEVDYPKIIKERFGVDIFTTPDKEMMKILDKYGVRFEESSISRNRLIDNLWKLIRRDLAGPAFLLNEPKFISPLAKSKPDNIRLTERFHIIIAGSENGNGYTELNDPIDQYDRFLDQQKQRDEGDDEAQMMDIDYVEMLEYGMPPTSGYAHGERLFWFLEGVTAREGTFFPQNKFHLEETTKAIYDIGYITKKKSTRKRNTFDDKLTQIRRKISFEKLDQIKDKDLISIDKDFLDKYNNPNVGVAIIKGVKVKKEDKKLEKLKNEVMSEISESLRHDEIDDLVNIESFHQMYNQMGLDTRSRKSSPEAMLRRLAEGNSLYTVNTCVDAYNLAVILTQVSAGAFDLDKFKFPVVLREAREGEKIEIIGGEVKELSKGEVCYFDRKGAYNMDYNYRDAERTKVTLDTKNLFINVEGVNSITQEQVADALMLTVELITSFCGGKVERMGLVNKK